MLPELRQPIQLLLQSRRSSHQLLPLRLKSRLQLGLALCCSSGCRLQRGSTQCHLCLQGHKLAALCQHFAAEECCHLVPLSLLMLLLLLQSAVLRAQLLIGRLGGLQLRLRLTGPASLGGGGKSGGSGCGGVDQRRWARRQWRSLLAANSHLFCATRAPTSS